MIIHWSQNTHPTSTTEDRTQERWTYVLSGDHFIKGTGFVSHPAVSMWLGFEDSLRSYINAHIQVWTLRGYKNTMQVYDLQRDPPKPAWFRGENIAKIVQNFQSTLIQREIERKESAWYIFMYEFICAWIQDPGLRVEFCSHVQKLIMDNSDWKNVYAPEYLLKYGHFEGFIGP